LSCGFWLIIWVLWIVKPNIPTEVLLIFALTDLAQEQHLAMGVLFVVAGLAELHFATVLTQSRSEANALMWPHSLWGVCFFWVGVCFVVHPQRDANETARHIAMGLGIAIGGVALAMEKAKATLDKDEPIWEAPLLIAAAVSFGLALLLLFTFPPPHAAHDNKVHPNWLNETYAPQLNVTYPADLNATYSAQLNATPAEEWHRGVVASCHVLPHMLTLAGLVFGVLMLAAMTIAYAARCCRHLRRRQTGSLVSKQECQQHQELAAGVISSTAGTLDDWQS